MASAAKIQYYRAIAYHSKRLSLANVKRIKIQFDPFAERAKTARDMLNHLSVRHLRMTNPACVLTPQVKNDRQPARMEVQYADEHKAIFKLENLTTLDTIKLFSDLAEEHEVKSKAKRRK